VTPSSLRSTEKGKQGMTELVPSTSSTSLTVFLPEEAKIKDAKADAIIEYAQKIQDWPLLMEAVEAKLEEQRKFVRWCRLSSRW
jgi:hypothetical protein